MSKPNDRNLRTLLREEEELHAEGGAQRHVRTAVSLFPIGLAVALLVLAAVFRGLKFAGVLIGTAVSIFTVLGKFAVPLGVGGTGTIPSLSVWELAAIVSYMDISIATILVYNLPRLYRVGRIGHTLEDLAEHGLYLLERQRWLARVTFVGVVAFVMFPLTGTGAIGGSIFGRLLGLSARRTLVAIAMGAVLGSFGMAVFADSVASIFTEDVRNSWEFKIAGGAILLLMFALVWWRGRRVTQELRARRFARGADTAGDTL